MLCFFVKTGNIFFNDNQKVLIDCLKLLVSKKTMVGFVFLTGLWKKRRNRQTVKNRCHPGLNWGPSAC